jgi:hypothetical protein
MEDLIISDLFQQLPYHSATNLEGRGWLIGRLLVAKPTTASAG